MPHIGKWLYGETDGSKLTAEQKETVTAITGLLGTATGAAVGNTTADAVSGSLLAQHAVENNALETGWDVANVSIGTISLVHNLNQGNYGMATLDAIGLTYDSVATAVPFLPAGASAGLKAYRAGNSIRTSLNIGNDVARATHAAHRAARNPATVGRNAAVTGTNVHRETARLLGENRGQASRLSSLASSYFRGSNKATGIQADLSWRGTRVWADLTTANQWGRHVDRYTPKFGDTAIPILYRSGEGVINSNQIKSGMGSVLILKNFTGE